MKEGLRMQVWAEGYLATGNEGTPQPATMLGEVEAASLHEACAKLAAAKPGFKEFWSPDSMTYWGCRLFDNERDARKSFG